jgi:hypothetical protein
MKTVTIRNRWTDVIMYEREAPSLRALILSLLAEGGSFVDANLAGANLDDAILDGANLCGASLRGAYLCGASLRGAILRGASLDYAILRGASLRGANLDGANLRGAILDDANLDGANLDGANLRDAILRGAILRGAILRGASLDGAFLRGAILDGASLDGASLDLIRYDVWAILDTRGNEVPALLAALRAGRVDGSTYEGACSCLQGTLARAAGLPVSAGEVELRNAGYEVDSSRPAERWFLGIAEGDTPQTNQVAKLAEEWVLAWGWRRWAKQRAAFGLPMVRTTDFAREVGGRAASPSFGRGRRDALPAGFEPA